MGALLDLCPKPKPQTAHVITDFEDRDWTREPIPSIALCGYPIVKMEIRDVKSFEK